MKIEYYKEDDSALIYFSSEKVDSCEDKENLIFHLSKNRKLVLLEILGASQFAKAIIDKISENKRTKKNYGKFDN